MANAKDTGSLALRQKRGNLKHEALAKRGAPFAPEHH